MRGLSRGTPYAMPLVTMNLRGALVFSLLALCRCGFPPPEADGITPGHGNLGAAPGAGSPGGSGGSGAGVADMGGGGAATGTGIGSGTLTGVMNGFTVAPIRTVFAVVNGSSFNVYLSDRADACAVLQAGATPKNGSFLRLGSSAGATPHTFPAGSYSFTPAATTASGSGGTGGSGGSGGFGGRFGGGFGGGGFGGGGNNNPDGGAGNGNGNGMPSAVIASADGTCALSGYDQTTAGGFTLHAPVDTSKPTTIEGTFDITFANMAVTGELKGTFSAPVCPNAKDIPLVPVACQ